MFTTYDLRNFLEGLAILFAIGYWGTMLLLLWFLVRLDSDGNEMSREKLENIITTFSEHRETATDVEVQAALKDRKSLSGSLQFI